MAARRPLMFVSCAGLVLVVLSQITYLYVGVSNTSAPLLGPTFILPNKAELVHEDLFAAHSQLSGWRRSGFLDRNISRSNVQVVDVRYYQGIHCDAPICPSFVRCGSKQSRIAACSDPLLVSPAPALGLPPLNYPANSFMDAHPRDRYLGQVFVMEDVFLNSRGHAFDDGFAYKHMNFCRGPTDFNYTAGKTRVTHFPELVSLAYWHGRNFFHTLVDMLPTITLMEDMLGNLSDIPVAVRFGQVPFLKMLSPLGFDVKKLNIRQIDDNELFFADKLILPAGPHCGRPQKPVWDVLREDRVLLPEARRLHPWPKSASRLRGNGQTDEASAAGGAPPEWRVALGDRAGRSRQVADALLLQAGLEGMFPGRVILFNGTMSLEEARLLFTSVRLFVSPHGALLTNMIFMRDGSSIVEMRPRGYNIGCYHHLADVCAMNYYLVYGNGTKDTVLEVDVVEVLNVVRKLPWLS